jgi:VanZ family protein
MEGSLKRIYLKQPMKKVRIFIISWLPLIAYCIFIFTLSSRPTSEHIPSLQYLDKFLHIMCYALLGVLFFRAYLTLPFKNNINILIIAAITSSTLYGISDEIHQAFVPSRYAGVADALADAVGSGLGVFGYQFFVNRGIDKVASDPP